jgi:hypothetical protein
MSHRAGGAADLDPKLERWLTQDADPSVRLKVYRDLLGYPESDRRVVRARREVGTKGWAASLLANQLPGGQWTTPKNDGGSLYRPTYSSTNFQLIVLAELGVTRAHPKARRAAGLLLRRWGAFLGTKGAHLCVLGNAVRMLVLLGYLEDRRVQPAIAELLRVQKRDGGWHCFPSRTGTLDSWEALAAFASIPPEERSPAVQRAIERGAEFYLERGAMREGPRYEPWFRLHYPNHYYYDVLLGLDLLTSLGYGRDRRLEPALEWLESRRRPDGQWPLDSVHPDIDHPTDPTADVPADSPYGIQGVQPPYFALGLELPGDSSRWITVRALTALHRAGRL